MPRRQWFGREHSKRGAGKLAVLQRSEQIGFDQMLAAADPTGPWSKRTRFSVPYPRAADLNVLTSCISVRSMP